LYERIVRSLSVQWSEGYRWRYPSLNLCDSGMVPEAERTYLTFCKQLEEKDRSDGPSTEVVLVTEVQNTTRVSSARI
jgi:hypothetical protein